MRRAPILFVCLPLAASCQEPVITRVVNAASYQPSYGPMASIATIFGSNLATTVATAQTIPLPLSLAGTSVTVGGVAAPLFYASPTQINLQMPSLGGVVVSTPAGFSEPFFYGSDPNNVWQAGGIFSADGSGCGQAAALNVAADGSLSVNSSSNAEPPGGCITLYGTGLLSFPQVTLDAFVNSPGPFNPLLTEDSIDYAWPVWEFSPQFAPFSQQFEPAGGEGLAPGYVGLDQLNIPIPGGLREGCAVPLQLNDYAGLYAFSQTVTIAVHSGGGACADPPSAGFGQITWQKTVGTDSSNATSETDTVIASLQASPGQQPPAYDVSGFGPPRSAVVLPGPACAVPGYRSLGAGSVTVQGPGLSATQVPLSSYQPGQVSGLSAYQATLPTGTIQAGGFTVAATGGADVGAFQVPMKIAADIQIQTPLAGQTFSMCGGIPFSWTGGDPNGWVTAGVMGQGGPPYPAFGPAFF